MAGQESLDDPIARYTDRARTAVAAAQEQARAYESEQLDTEHILLGLVAAGDGVAAAVLKAIGISLETVRQHIEPADRAGPKFADVLALTADAEGALNRASLEAAKCGDDYIGTQHLLLGLLSAGNNTAAEVLTTLGATYTRVLDEYLSLVTAFTDGRPLPGREPTGRELQAPPRIGLPPELDQYNQRITEAQKQKEAAVDAQDFDAAATARTTEKAVLAERNALIRRWADDIDVVILVEEIDRLHHEIDRLKARLGSLDTQPAGEP